MFLADLLLNEEIDMACAGSIMPAFLCPRGKDADTATTIRCSCGSRPARRADNDFPDKHSSLTHFVSPLVLASLVKFYLHPTNQTSFGQFIEKNSCLSKSRINKKHLILKD